MVIDLRSTEVVEEIGSCIVIKDWTSSTIDGHEFFFLDLYLTLP